MGQSKIFLANDTKDSLVPMVETTYTQEEILQALVARYPDLLPGDQIDPDQPRRWLLVRREMGVADGENAVDRWSLDHLFLDQDAIPTFVECKRSQDTRIRREVIAQMLEYAANGIVYWSIDKLRQAAAETAAANGVTLDDSISDLIDAEDEAMIQEYWDKLEANLKDGIVRLLFVADAIPKELRRLVEFLNDKLQDVEVLAVEIKQFQGGGQEAWVPRVIGQSEAVRSKKGADRKSRAVQLNWDSFQATIDESLVPFYNKLMDLAEEQGFHITWGTKYLIIKTPLPGRKSFVFGDYERVEFYFKYLNLSEAQNEQVRAKFAEFGIQGTDSGWTYRATFDVDGLEKSWDVYVMALDVVGDILSGAIDDD